MLLRPRQEVFVGRVLAALEEHGSTLGIAPTGAGKTVMMSAIIGRHGGRALVLQHRDELVEQNRRTFQAVNPGVGSTVWTASDKRWSQTATFAMVPTLSREGSLSKMPAFDLVLCDEAHHAAADSWMRIIERARELNPDVKVCGVTATPNRADKKGLRKVFGNVADQITVAELIRAGHLVAPRAMVIDVGISDGLSKIPKTRVGEYDMAAVEALMDVAPVTDAILGQWRAQAGDRRTIAFCSTVGHAEHVAEAFRAAGVAAACVTGETGSEERKRTFRALDRGELQVLTNVAVATEGFDSPPISCVMLLRPSSCESTMVQMIGRGLRTIDPKRYPGLVKTDCVVMDFGRSLLTHGGIEQLVDLDGKTPGEGEGGPRFAPKKACPGCKAMVPLGCKSCPLCSYSWPQELREVQTLEEFRMVELDLLIGQSPFSWWSFNERCRVATAFKVWAVAFSKSGVWHAFGGDEGVVEHLASGTENVCVAAGDDWMRQRGDRKAAGRNREWLAAEPTPKQLAHLERMKLPTAVSRYEAACLMTLKFAKRRIERELGVAA